VLWPPPVEACCCRRLLQKAALLLCICYCFTAILWRLRKSARKIAKYTPAYIEGSMEQAAVQSQLQFFPPPALNLWEYAPQCRPGNRTGKYIHNFPVAQSARISQRHFEAWFSMQPPPPYLPRPRHNHPPVTVVGPMPGRGRHGGPLHPNGQVQGGWHSGNCCRLPRLGPQGVRLLGQQLGILVVHSNRSTLSHAGGAPGRGRQASLSSPPLSNTFLAWRPSFQMAFLSPVGGNRYSFSPLL
jgi:hypothetical protein